MVAAKPEADDMGEQAIGTISTENGSVDGIWRRHLI